jgi:hypothetical protein
VPGTFTKRTLDPDFRAEGVGVFDVDRDGHLDIATDEFWYAGPQFDVRHEIREPETYPLDGNGHAMGVYPEDVDGDGWLDLVISPHPTETAYWYKNPGPEASYRNPGPGDTHWARYVIKDEEGLETPIVDDLFGDGHPVLLMTDNPTVSIGWYTPPSDPTQEWDEHVIASGPFACAGDFVHGIGTGDVNGDGRRDVLTCSGWIEQTPDRTVWKVHPVTLGPAASRACSRMWTYDFDGDGRADILCGRPHDFGVYWFQQQPAEAGADPIFVEKLIDDSIQENHAVRLADLDGDGVPEVITGKRWWAEGPGQEAGDPPVLAYFKMSRGEGAGVSFARHVIDDDSGAGTQFTIQDLDGDGKPDIVVSNKKGLFVFHQN